MGILDAFSKEDRLEITVKQLMELIDEQARLRAENKIMLRGYENNVYRSTVLTLLGYDQKKEG